MGCTFFFGAGAESDYGIGVGASFVEPLLRGAYEKERKALLGSDRGGYKLIHHASKNIYLQSIIENEEKAIDVFGSATVDLCKKNYENKEEGKEQISDYCKQWYRIITTNDALPDIDKPIKTFFLKNSIFFNTLDEKFNSLRRQPLDSRAKRVINAYVTVFILMISSVYKIPENFEWKYKNVFDLIQSDYNNIDFNVDSYYKILAALLNKRKEEKEKYFIATTNYTKIVEEVTKKSNITYLHGNLEWFEDANNLTVYDCSHSEERELAEKNLDNIFPFILIPSGVKPIICRKQMDQYSNFIEKLDRSKFLFVVGYKFNSEDNHINSILGEWLRQPGHRMLYLNYNNSLKWNSMCWAENFERDQADANKITPKTVNDFLSGDYKILNIIATSETSARSCFSIVCECIFMAEKKK